MWLAFVLLIQSLIFLLVLDLLVQEELWVLDHELCDQLIKEFLDALVGHS